MECVKMYSSEIVEKSPWDKLNIARDKNYI